MSKQLDPADFRALRWKLDPDDFAIGPEGPEPPARDLIDQETWESIIVLPDHVSIRTSDNFGEAIRATHGLSAEWVSFTLDVFGPEETPAPPLNSAIVNSFSELQASLYNAVVGYYRTGISAMRNAIEHLTIGLDYQLWGDTAKFMDWMNGNEDDTIKFGNSAARLANQPAIKVFEARIKGVAGDNLFRQKDKSKGDAGGFSRRLFSELSKYTHGAPGRTEVDLWESNGPVFRPTVFLEWCSLFGKVIALAALIVRLGVPLNKRSATDAKNLFNSALALVPQGEDGESLLAAIAQDEIWEASSPSDQS